jgi:hypothetical protein
MFVDTLIKGGLPYNEETFGQSFFSFNSAQYKILFIHCKLTFPLSLPVGL